MLRLLEYLTTLGIKNKIANEDADCLIVRTALEMKQPISDISIVGNDVDLLVLSIALTPVQDNICFLKDAPKKPTALFSTMDNKHYHSYISFAHAFADCDTTGAFYNVRKKSIFKVLSTKEELKNQ